MTFLFHSHYSRCPSANASLSHSYDPRLHAHRDEPPHALLLLRYCQTRIRRWRWRDTAIWATGTGDRRLRILGEEKGWKGETKGCEVTSTKDDAC